MRDRFLWITRLLFAQAILVCNSMAADLNLLATYGPNAEAAGNLVDNWMSVSSSSLDVTADPDAVVRGRIQPGGFADAADIFVLGGREVTQMCLSGALSRIDLDAALDGMPTLSSDSRATELLGTFSNECGVPLTAYSQTIVFDASVISDGSTISADAFFDPARIPGKRALPRSPRGMLELALVADGVSQNEVYAVLSTDAGVQRALSKISSIKGEIVWMNSLSESAGLLATQQAAMSLAWSGNIPPDMMESDRIGTVPSYALVDFDFLAISANSTNNRKVLEFIDFTSRPENIKEFLIRTPGSMPALTPIPDQLNKKYVQACAAGTCGCQGGGCSKSCCPKSGIFANLQTDHSFWIENEARIEALFEAALLR